MFEASVHECISGLYDFNAIVSQLQQYAERSGCTEQEEQGSHKNSGWTQEH